MLQYLTIMLLKQKKFMTIGQLKVTDLALAPAAYLFRSFWAGYSASLVLLPIRLFSQRNIT